MRDVYTECVVPNIPTGKDKFKQTCYLVLTVVFAIGMLIFSWIFVIAAAAFGYLYYREKQKADSEYEYVHTNEIFDVDQVCGNASRKQLFTTQLQRVVLVAPVDSPEVAVFRNAKILDFSGNQQDALYAMICDANGQKQKLILQLSRPMLAGLRQWLPGKVITKDM